jgi:hypothetical protein
MLNSSTSVEEVLGSYLEQLAIELLSEIPLEKVTLVRGSEELLRELILKAPTGTYRLTFGIDLTTNYEFWVSLKKVDDPKSFSAVDWGIKRIYKLPVLKLAEAVSKWTMSKVQV